MTYCVGLKLNEGLVMLADTRTNAGVDDIASFRKMFVFEQPGERAFTIMTAGNLSVTQTVIAKLEQAINAPEPTPETSIMLAPSILHVAEIIGDVLCDVSSNITQKFHRINEATQLGTASMILAGQVKGSAPRLFRLYQEGNFIEATRDTPFMQIGEHKYGKPILDRVITPETTLKDGQKAVLLSMDSTLRSNLSVGMPLDLTIIKNDEFKIHEHRRIEKDDKYFRAISDAWSEALRASFKAMP